MMNHLSIEIKKEKRTGILEILWIVGLLGAGYAWLNFILRKETLLNLPLDPMDILLTQLYGMLVLLNTFGIICSTGISYALEFKGHAIKKMYLLPIDLSKIFLAKFILLAFSLVLALGIEYGVLALIGSSFLPAGTFDLVLLLKFALYSLITSLPVLSFMLLVASQFENIWITLGIGILGFLGGMSFSTMNFSFFRFFPFVIMLDPALHQEASIEPSLLWISIIETFVFLGIGLLLSRTRKYE